MKCDERRRRDVDTATVPVMLRRRKRRDRGINIEVGSHTCELKVSESFIVGDTKVI